MPKARLDRTVFRLSGEGVTDWLSGLITNTLNGDVTLAALLTPQGKIIADFFVTRDGDDLLMDTPGKFADELHRRLCMYKLRAPVRITKTDLCVYALWGDDGGNDDGDGAQGHADPRDPRLGRRLISDYTDTENRVGDYDIHRLSLGIPDSERDFDTVRMFPADANMDLLGGVDYKKGCFVGQEVVSRMYRKSNVKKRMRGFMFGGRLSEPPVIAPITANDRLVGDVLHTNGTYGMALIRLNRLEGYDGPLMVGQTEIKLMEA
ncbi:MAG: folate-binding protein YgfZ [Hyphomonadaceae bacterium]|nr:folate-binding protein YgfZ [Hyphomonadaceae bacterium]MBC6411788.1 folate-binding protein YgfZ [Hyphomonadaceae bacterium]